MANGKKKTTMAKLNRETRMRERRHEKAARKAARKLDAANGTRSWDVEPEADPWASDDDDARAETPGVTSSAG